MGLKEALKRFRVPHVETVEEVRAVLDDIEQSYNQLLFYLEQQAPLTPKYLTAELSASQNANLAAGNHVEFDTKSTDSGHIALSTGTGQANGIFTIPPGVWVIEATLDISFSASTGVATLRFRDDPGGSELDHGGRFAIRPLTSGDNVFTAQRQTAILNAATSTDVKLEIDSITSVSSINVQGTSLVIFALA